MHDRINLNPFKVYALCSLSCTLNWELSEAEGECELHYLFLVASILVLCLLLSRHIRLAEFSPSSVDSVLAPSNVPWLSPESSSFPSALS